MEISMSRREKGKHYIALHGIGVVICILLFSMFAGCGVQKHQEPPEEIPGQEESLQSGDMIGYQAGDSYYVPQTQKLKIPDREMGESMGWIDGSVMTDNALYYIYHPANYMQPPDSDAAVKLYRVPLDELFSNNALSGAYPLIGTESLTESVPLPENLPVFGKEESGEYIQRFFANEKGELYFLCAPSGEKVFYRLYILDAEGNLTEDVMLTESLEGFKREEMITENYLNTHPSAVDGEGNIYLTDKLAGKIWILNRNGELLNTFDFPEYDLKSLAVKDGNVYGAVKKENHNWIVTIDAEAGAFTELFALPETEENVFLLTDGKSGLFYGGSKGLYACHIDAEEAEKLFDWTGVDVNGEQVQNSLLMNLFPENPPREGLGGTDFASVLVLDENNTLTLTTRIETTAIPDQKERVVLGVITADSDLKNQVAEFNRRSFYYEVEIKEYGVDNGIQRMETEIATGKGPDLFPLTAVDVPKFIHQGLFADLSAFLEDGKGLERKDLVEGVLRCHTRDGVLVCVPASFSLDVLTGRASTLPASDGWSIEEYLDYVAAGGEAEVVRGSYLSRTEAEAKVVLALLAVYGNLDYFADWEKGEAHFDSPEFLYIMQFAKNYHTTINSVSGKDILSFVRDGGILFYNSDLHHMNDYLVRQAVLDGNAGFIGYPTADGSPCYGIYGQDAYGIWSGSGKKDGAWAFIEFLLTVKASDNEKLKESAGFPTMAEEFEAMLQKSMIKSYQKNEMWEFLRDKNGEPIEIPGWSLHLGGESYGVYAAAETDVEAVKELVERASFSSEMRSSTVYGIVDEELIYYMDGAKTAEETVEIIQNRVQLFLDEQQ
ncbi:MAG: extracellular solute-binding protein [Clostridium sp.]|nr:extracellular solute-binding protein [Clostridium sp.]